MGLEFKIPSKKAISQPTPEAAVRRLLLYFEYLKNLDTEFVSSAQISLRFNFTAIV